jgi:hypothetical protein
MSVEGFERTASTDGGRTALLRAPKAGRFVARTSPNSQMHGGGSPAFAVLPAADARTKYNLS